MICIGFGIADMLHIYETLSAVHRIAVSQEKGLLAVTVSGPSGVQQSMT